MASPWKLKSEMCEIGRRLYDRGLISAFEGNLSARLGSDRVLCTPTLVCKGFLKPEDLCVVDMTGRQISGERKRTSEVLLHLAVYRERPDVEAVVHSHPPHITAFAFTHTAVPQCVAAEVEVFLGQVPMAPYATPGTQEFADTILPLVRDAVVVVLANHGVISWGKSLEQAEHRTELLEAYCRTLILARQLGSVERLSDQNMRDLLALKERLGLPDHRTSFENCDLCGNNVFGRGFHDSGQVAALPQDRPGAWGAQGLKPSDGMASALAGYAPSENRDTAHSRGHAAQSTLADLEAMVQEIADRVMAEVNR